MTSSILSIIVATSVALIIACVFIFRGSMIPCCHASIICPVNTFRPAFMFSFSCACFNSAIVFIVSRPAFSASVFGIISNASAKLCAANCSLPFSVCANVFSCFTSSASVLPAPGTACFDCITEHTSPIASSTALVVSSATCGVVPFTSMDIVFGFSHSLIIVIYSSPVFICSIIPACPSAFSVSFKSVIIFAFVAWLILCMSLLFTLLIA